MIDLATVPTPMPTGLVPVDLIARAKEYAQASKAPATLKTYGSVWATFTAWCDRHGLDPLPATADTLVAYIADQSEQLRPQTIKKHLAAISQVHQLRGHRSPVQAAPVKLTMQGLRRVKGVAAKPKAALRVEHVKAVVAAMPGDLVGIRDTAIVLLGFVAGMRRSEIVALDVDAVAFEPEGIVISIRKSKRDQEGKRQVAVPRGREATCPVRAVRRWLDVSGIQNGPLFVRLDPRPGTAVGQVRRADREALPRVRDRPGAVLRPQPLRRASTEPRGQEDFLRARARHGSGAKTDPWAPSR